MMNASSVLYSLVQPIDFAHLPQENHGMSCFIDSWEGDRRLLVVSGLLSIFNIESEDKVERRSPVCCSRSAYGLQRRYDRIVGGEESWNCDRLKRGEE